MILQRNNWTAATIVLVSLTACGSNYKGNLAEVINAYRQDQGLPEIPISESLTQVAKAHIRDLLRNNPVQGDCNLHSWSTRGDWSSCCYTDDHAQAECMWNKPRELSGYLGEGFEIAADGAADPNDALDIWRGSEAHHEVVVNEGIWADNNWKALGAAMDGGFAVAWFGNDEDLEGQR